MSRNWSDPLFAKLNLLTSVVFKTKSGFLLVSCLLVFFFVFFFNLSVQEQVLPSTPAPTPHALRGPSGGD